MLFLGCDGGSTKTEFLLASEETGLLSHKFFPACNYLETGEELFSTRMRTWIIEVLTDAGVEPEDLTFSVFGLPAMGEVEGLEEKVRNALQPYALLGKSLLCNDSVLGWAGSLAGETGINIVSGTGSIAYGEDEFGNCKRVSGWSLLFDDPGSSTWVARQTLGEFFRQADGRSQRGPLYSILCEYWSLGDHPEYFGGKVLSTLNKDRTALASLQLQAKRALIAGDIAVRRIYDCAVDELVHTVDTVRNALRFDTLPVKVSYSGGFFKNGEIILQPFREKLGNCGMVLCAPCYTPAVGSLALAAKRYLSPTALSNFLMKIQEVIISSTDNGI